MFGSIAKSLFGSSNDRYVNSIRKTVAKINAFEPEMEAKSDEELKAQTPKFRARLDAGALDGRLDRVASECGSMREIEATSERLRQARAGGGNDQSARHRRRRRRRWGKLADDSQPAAARAV